MNTVPMTRDGKKADVHKSEVDNWKAAGWTVVETKAEPAKKTASAPKKD